MTRAMPRGTTWKVLIIRNGSPFPAGFSQLAVAGVRVISRYA